MSITIIPVSNARTRRDFLHLPQSVYANDPAWVQPLAAVMKRMIDPSRNGYLKKGPHRLFVAYRDGRPAGRIMAGIDGVMNLRKGRRDGWFALFEAEDDTGIARGLIDAARDFLAAEGCDRMRGPVSPTGSEDFRGLLVQGHGSPPVLMDSYNPPYYAGLLEGCGLAKDYDWLAYRYFPRMPKNPRAVQYAQARYGFRLDRLDLSRLEREIGDIKQIIDRSMPEWPDAVPPTLEEVRNMARDLKSYADPDLIYIARADGEPIGFSVVVPDLNQALIHLRGRLFPTGWIRFLLWRRRIDALRFFALFVVPEWRGKGVTAAIFVRTFEVGSAKGYKWLEGSTIREENLPMRRDAERAGGELYKVYRIFACAL